MNNILYIKIDENVEVTHPRVYLQDIAELTCSNTKLLNRIRILPVVDFNQLQGVQYIISIMDLIKAIEKKEPDLQIESLGEEDFILTYHPPKKTSGKFFFKKRTQTSQTPFFQKLKVLFVCLVSFFGSAFSIMTFNCDADVGTLLNQIYTQVTRKPSDGFTILEITYSIGIGIGVLCFFNHFGQFKFSSEPTPLQVQMCLYEKNIDTTIIKDKQRSRSQA